MKNVLYGYRFENGKAVIDEDKAQNVRILFENYLSGTSLKKAAENAGIFICHASVKKMLTNRRYTGDDFYPAIIDLETYNHAEEEREKRAIALGRVKEPKAEPIKKPLQKFYMREAVKFYDIPSMQAQYIYNLIESEE